MITIRGSPNFLLPKQTNFLTYSSSNAAKLRGQVTLYILRVLMQLTELEFAK